MTATATSTANEADNEEISLKEIFFVLMAKKLQIALACFGFGLFSVGYALWLQNVYSAEALLAYQGDRNSVGGANSIASQLGGVAKMAGLNLDGSAANFEKNVAIETMKTRQFFANFYAEILPELAASESWDEDDQILSYDLTKYDPDKGEWFLRPDGKSHKLSLQAAHREFRSRFSVSKSTLTGLVTVRVRHISPAVAQNWIELVIENINEVTRKEASEEAEAAIKFLQRKLLETNLVPLQEALADLIEDQTQTLMLADLTEDYAFKVIEPPALNEERDSPNRALICIVITSLGGFFTCLFLVIQHYRLRGEKILRNS